MSNTGNTQQIIDYGATANDGTGDPLRTAFIKTDENFSNIWAAGPVGSNITIANNTIQNDSTNGNIILKPNGVGVIQANASILPSIDGIRDLGSSTRAWRRAYIDVMETQDLTLTGNLDVAGDAVIQGNLTVEGDTIQIGNITTDTLLIQLANAATTDAQADGAGVTVGANDDIATLLYDSATNSWMTNIPVSVAGNVVTPVIITNDIRSDDSSFVRIQDGLLVDGQLNVNDSVSATGNITAPYFIGDGSQLTGMYGNANVVANLAALSTNPISTAGNITTNRLTGNAAVLAGVNSRGEHAANLGVPGFTELNANVIVQITGDANTYAQVNFQNINAGNRATTDYIATASAGTDSTYFVDMGIASNSYDSANPNNSLGNSLYPQDSYLYSQGGNSPGGTGGNLVVGSNEPGGVVRIIADGSFTDNIVATFSNTGIEVKGNITPTANGTYSLGNSTNWWSNLWVANNTIYIGGVALGIGPGNVLTVGGNAVLQNDSNTSISTTGNITADYFFGDGSQLTGLNTDSISNGTSNVEVATANGNVVITTDGTYQWNFAADGILTVPGDLVGSGASPAPSLSGFDSLSAISANLSGNVTANYFIGDGSQLTGLPEQYGNSNVVTLLGAFGSNNISTTGTITGNLVAPANTTANTYVLYNDSGVIGGSGVFTFDENGNVLTIGTTSGTLKVADIQTPQAGVNLRFIPSSGTTLSYGHLNPQFANTYDLGQSGSRWNNMFANVANVSTLAVTGAATATSITLSSTGTAVNASAGNILTNRVTGTQFAFLNGVYTAVLTGAGATANYTLNLPANAGSNGQSLTSDGTGNLIWSTPASSYGDSNVATFLAAYGSNTISTSGNITAGNLAGNISITGNVTGTGTNVNVVAASYTWTFNNAGNLVLPGNTFAVNYANGTAVSLGGSYGNANVATFLAAYGSNTISTSGNVTAANFTGNISITGNVTGTSSNVELVAGVYSTVFDNTGNVTLPGNLVFSDNSKFSSASWQLVESFENLNNYFTSGNSSVTMSQSFNAYASQYNEFMIKLKPVSIHNPYDRPSTFTTIPLNAVSANERIQIDVTWNQSPGATDIESAYVLWSNLSSTGLLIHNPNTGAGDNPSTNIYIYAR